MFKKLENNRPFLKMALEGFAGDGKSFTATQIGIGVHKLIQSDKPIAIFDTEKAFKALKMSFDDAGIEAVVDDEQRSLAALSEAIKWCEAGNSDILIIDSITHVWEEYLKAYLNRPDKNGKIVHRNRLEFQDWGVIKPKWKEEFSTPFVLAKCHIIFTGRAGYEYTDEKNEDGKREIYKSGIKMKAETETAFEPDILVLMQQKQDILTDAKRIWREATILKDRTSIIDGETFKYFKGDGGRVFSDFYPAIKVLLNGTLKELHGASIPDTFQEFESRYSEAAKDRTIIIAEIEGCFELMGLGTGADHKQIKAWTLNQVYGVNSLEALQKKNITVIKQGLEVIKNFAEQYKKYFNQCLDNETPVEKGKVQQIMKSLLNEPIK